MMCRGDWREDIFREDGDREMMLAETVEKTGWKVHAWVLMGNHYHLLLQTPEPNLVKGMTWFQTTYTLRFNAKHRLRVERRMATESAAECGLSEIAGQSLQSALRRGWYFGKESFREWLLEKAGAQLGGHRKKRQNYVGPEIKAHGMAEAQRLLREGLVEQNLRTYKPADVIDLAYHHGGEDRAHARDAQQQFLLRRHAHHFGQRDLVLFDA